MQVKHPEVVVQLSGEDGNVFNLIGIVRKALRKAGVDASPMVEQVMNCGSYDEALRVMMSWVTVK